MTDWTPFYARPTETAAGPGDSGRAGRIPGVVYEEHLEGVFQYYQRQFGGPRMVGGLPVGANVTVGPA